MATRLGRCCLCGRDHMQLCRAHIIPSALLGAVAGKTQSRSPKAQDADFMTLRADKEASYQGAAKAFQYDTSIICAECDGNILGTYDEALAKFCKDWINGSSEKNKIAWGRFDFPLTNIESSGRLFLGIVAILWRASVSARFPDVKLGKYSDQFRRWLYSGCLPPEPEQVFAISAEAYPLENFGIDGLDQLRLSASPEILCHKLAGGIYYELFLPSVYIGVRVGRGDGRDYDPKGLWRAKETYVPLTVKPYPGSRHASITAEVFKRATGQPRSH